MKILVTGATGLIGRNLLKKLNDNDDIVVVSRHIEELQKLNEEFPNIIIDSGDIADENRFKDLIGQVDIVYHLAAMRAVGVAEQNVESCIYTNIIGTINILKHFKGDKFITLSTDKAVQINSVYGATKFLVEKLIREKNNTTLQSIYRVIRCGNVFGSTESVMSVWKRLLEEGKEINVTDLDSTRFFCSVDQVIDSIFNNTIPFTEVIQCLDLKSTTLRTLLEAMQIKYGIAKKINIIGRQVGENKHERLSEGGISSDIAPKYTVEELLKLI